MSRTGWGLARAVAAVLAVLGVWQLLSTLRLLPGEAVPSPVEVAADLWSNRADYLAHLGATLASAALGYGIGNSVALAAAVAFVRWPVVERLARGFNLAVFATPAIALGPLLAVAFQGALPQIALAAVGVYFATMTAAVVGLGQADPAAVDVVRLYGGGEGAVMRRVRLRAALPAVMGGLRAGASASILGAMLAEFGSGAPGLGSLLLASVSLGRPARVWGVALAATAVSLAAYGLLSRLGAALSWRPVGTLGVPAATGRTRAGPATSGGAFARAGLAAAAVVLPLLAWQALPDVLHVSPVVARTPLSLWSYTVAGSDAAAVRHTLFAAAGQTLPLALGGMGLGCAAALGLALAGDASPRLARAVLPAILLLQSTPLVVLAPLIVLLLGRGVATTLAVAVSVCFFPAYVTLSQAVGRQPEAALDILRLYGAGRLDALRFVVLPYLTPYLFAAARMVGPAALLGVMTAEWLATGVGLGGQMNDARGDLDYGMIWTVAFLSVALSAGVYQLILWAEKFLFQRMFPQP